MITDKERAFADAHPAIADRYAIEGLEWLNVYSDYDEGKLVEKWERDKDGYLVDVTRREKAREEIARIQEELEELRRKENVKK